MGKKKGWGCYPIAHFTLFSISAQNFLLRKIIIKMSGTELKNDFYFSKLVENCIVDMLADKLIFFQMRVLTTRRRNEEKGPSPVLKMIFISETLEILIRFRKEKEFSHAGFFFPERSQKACF
jgi:hypothetical protein